MKTILAVCKKAEAITDAEIEAAEEMAKGQLEYFSPLKMKTSGRQHALGTHNMAVLAKLRELRDKIREGKSLFADVE